jgi:scyllo-inositol 2-dehydrogenase (NADP+)
MRILIIGLGVQGTKRLKVAGSDVVATVDKYKSEADFKNLKEVPLDLFDSAILCTPDEPKFELIQYLLENSKHALVEKPLWVASEKLINKMEELANSNEVLLQTAYNHRFEPNILRAKTVIENGELGDIYSCSLFYGNGTAQIVRESNWRDMGLGVVKDLGSHLLDIVSFWFSASRPAKFDLRAFNFENKSPDHAIMTSLDSSMLVNLEISLCMWQNDFRCDIIGSEGSLHINGLCKWGPSRLSVRKRVRPSGIPNKRDEVQTAGDPTWRLEYQNFKQNIEKNIKTNLDVDRWILKILKDKNLDHHDFK